MLDIQIQIRSRVPIYKQISDQVKNLIANKRLSTGSRMPTVRELSRELHINAATVARAYQELGEGGFLGGNRRRGTIVMGDTDNTKSLPLRKNHFASTINDLILDAFSVGYKPDELERMFTLQLARWRIQGNTSKRSQFTPHDEWTEIPGTIRIVGSHDPALLLLIKRLRSKQPKVDISITDSGSLGGLLAIAEGKADMAGIHLPDEESGQYNYPFIKKILPNREVAVVHLAERIQGLMVNEGNPKHIHNLEVAEVISKNGADAGPGIKAAANTHNLDFLPLNRERLDLVIPVTNYRNPLFASIIKIIRSEEFKQAINDIEGYDTARTGETIIVK